MYLQFLWLPQVSQNNLPVALSDFHASPELPSLSQLTAHYKFPSDFIGSGPSTALWVCEIVTSTRCGVHAGSPLHALHAVQHRHLGTYCRQSLLSIVFGAILACRLRVLCSPSSGSDIIILCGRQKARRVKPCSGLARQFGLVSYDIQSSEPEHRASQGAPRVIGASAGSVVRSLMRMDLTCSPPLSSPPVHPLNCDPESQLVRQNVRGSNLFVLSTLTPHIPDRFVRATTSSICDPGGDSNGGCECNQRQPFLHCYFLTYPAV